MTNTSKPSLIQRNHSLSPISNRNCYQNTSWGISIIIPTFKRVVMCETLLISLQKSRRNVETPVEIIFVDNSPKKEAKQIQTLCHQYHVQYYYREIGVGAKRNFGASIATYPIILFIDSDCEATPNLIYQHLNCYSINPNTVAVLGKTEFKGETTFIWKAIQYTPFIVPFTLGNQSEKQVWGPSNNLSCRKNIFEEINGFDESFPDKPGGEDVDLGYRFYKKGYLLTTNNQALIYHTTETWNTFNQVFNRLFNWGQVEFHLYYNHADYLYYDSPKGLGICLLFTLLGIFLSIWETNYKWLLLPGIFLIIDFCFRSIVHFYYYPERIKNINKVFLAEILILVYELGLICKCIKKLWFLPLYSCLIVTPEQASLIWNQKVIQIWLTFIQLVLTIVVVYSL